MTTKTLPTKDELSAGLKILLAVAETLREVGQAPAGLLYAPLMGRMDLSAFNKMLSVLERQNLIRRDGNWVAWIGPKL